MTGPVWAMGAVRVAPMDAVDRKVKVVDAAQTDAAVGEAKVVAPVVLVAGVNAQPKRR